MRWRLATALVLAATALTAAEPAWAQFGDNIYSADPRSSYRRAPQSYGQADPRRGGGGPYYPGMLINPLQPRAVAPPPPQPQPGFSLRRLFGVEDEAPRQALQPRPPRPRPDRPRPPVAVAKQEKPKVNPSTHVVVFGDALADLTGQGLEDAFEETPDVAVARKIRSEG